jgi:NADH-quinone oxidoreductase subunit I
VTTSYPQAKRAKQPRQHGRHVLNRYEDGMEKCIGCELCAGVCPVNCIYVRGLDNPPDHPVSPGERYGYIYEINYLRCIHCDLCVEACPTQAITESKMFEFSFTNRADAIYTKAELLVDDQGFPQRLPWEDWREGEAAMTGGWMRATSPAGDAASRASCSGRPTWARGCARPKRVSRNIATTRRRVPSKYAKSSTATSNPRTCPSTARPAGNDYATRREDAATAPTARAKQ